MLVAYAVFLLCALERSANAYPRGPPATSCLDMQPYHKNPTVGGFHAPTVSNVYQITVMSQNYTAGGTVQVVLSSSAGEKFEGFVVTARRDGGRYTDMSIGPLIGTFACSNSHNATMRYHSLYSPTNASNCVTHAMEEDYTSLRCNWTAPNSNEGPIKFVATVVKDFDKYFHVESQQLPNAAGLPANEGGVSTLTSVPALSGCGSTKTCALYPPLCDKRGQCSHGVAMTVQQDSSLLFEMFGTTVQWIGLGIADNTEMESMELFTCAYDDTTKKTLLKLAYSPKKSVVPVYRPDVTMRKTMVQMDSAAVLTLPAQPHVIACQFVRPRVANFTYYQFSKATWSNSIVRVTSDMAIGSYVVLAQGPLIGTGSQNMAKHQHKPLKSPEMFNSNSVKLMYFAGLSKKVQTHATLMSIFWLFLAGLAIVIARHSRPVLTQKVAFGKNLWFVVHIISVLFGFILSVSGVVYILVAEGGWESDAQTHGILGLIALGLALVNIVAGLFRPDPDAKFRWLFNRLHRWNGLLSLLFATITVWLGATFYEHRPEFRLYAVIVLAVWTGLQVIFMIAFECARHAKVKKATVEREIENKYKMAAVNTKDEAEEINDQQQQQKPLKGKWLVHANSLSLFLYTGVFAALLVAFITGLWLH